MQVYNKQNLFLGQVADFARHKWNCVPVMVTEIPGKGRGLVAAKNIKIGEVILTDKPVIKIFTKRADDINDFYTFEENIGPVLEQLNKLPSEAIRQCSQLTIPEDILGFESDCEFARSVYLKCMGNWRTCRALDGSGLYCHILSLNFALVNHSCVPNVAMGAKKLNDECKVEVRAIKDISRGEEVTVSYLNDDYISEFGLNRQKRREKLKKALFFDCNCSFCSENPD